MYTIAAQYYEIFNYLSIYYLGTKEEFKLSFHYLRYLHTIVTFHVQATVTQNFQIGREAAVTLCLFTTVK